MLLMLLRLKWGSKRTNVQTLIIDMFFFGLKDCSSEMQEQQFLGGQSF